MTSSNGNIFRVTGPLCGEFTGPGEFPTQRPVTRSFDVYFDLGPNEWLSKQWRRWWFKMPSRSLWRHCNDTYFCHTSVTQVFMRLFLTQNFLILPKSSRKYDAGVTCIYPPHPLWSSILSESNLSIQAPTNQLTFDTFVSMYELYRYKLVHGGT